MGNKKHQAALLLGGNIGDTAAVFREATEKLEEHLSVQSSSGLYRTEPWGMEGADDFLNQALLVSTQLSARELLSLTANVEREFGRVQENESGSAYQSRTLDIDILFYDDEVIEEKDLKIPHPKLHLRNFALKPLAEIAAEKNHPVFQKTIGTLLEECPDELSAERI